MWAIRYKLAVITLTFIFQSVCGKNKNIFRQSKEMTDIFRQSDVLAGDVRQSYGLTGRFSQS